MKYYGFPHISPIKKVVKIIRASGRGQTTGCHRDQYPADKYARSLIDAAVESGRDSDGI